MFAAAGAEPEEFMGQHFEPIRLERQHEYLERLSFVSQMASDYSFINLWGWAEVHGLLWAWEKDGIWIKQTLPREVNWAPVGNWEEMDWDRWFSGNTENRNTFTRIPEKLADLWKNHFGSGIILSEARGHWDYLYDVNELIELPGNRFHKKKNLLNQFKKTCNYTVEPLGTATVKQALAMQEDWCTWRDCESSEGLSAENGAISRVLRQWENLSGLMGGAIRINEKMVAYTVGEKLSDDTLVIHFEKGSPEYKGIYQAINNLFLEQLKREPSHHGLCWVNREQDLDDEGLRKAKLSYNPSGYIRKFTIRIS